MTAHVIRGDVRALPLPDASVDLIVTSPPYWSLRSYTDGGEHYDGQIGSEPTPAEYIDTLLDCTREWVRVLKPTGSLFVNLGDTYVDKDRQCLPEQYRIACGERLGLYRRAVIIWKKANGLPESVTDRVRASHEDWVHLVKQPRYYSAVDEIREPHVRDWSNGKAGGGHKYTEAWSGRRSVTGLAKAEPNTLGKLPGSVWTIPSEPLKVPDHLGIDHFAAFPTEWPRRLIRGWSPPGICVECGEGRRPVVAKRLVGGHLSPGARDYRRAANTVGGGSHWDVIEGRTEATIAGYACTCLEPTAPTRPAVVLDPFGGTGTTALVASALGRIGLTVDRSWDYCRLAQWRTSDPGQVAKVLGVAKPPVQVEGQLSLIDGLENNDGEVA